MNGIGPYQNMRIGRLGRWLAIVALPAMVVAGCGGDDDDVVPTPTAQPSRTFTATPPRTPTPTPTMVNQSASAACDKLVSCDQCMADSTGNCIANSACAARVDTDVAICINGITGCDQTALGDCVFPGCDGNDASGDCN